MNVISGGVQLQHRLASKTLLLLALLATERKKIFSRQEVAFTLWPDCPESEAKANLRRHLYQLHQALAASPIPLFRCGTRTISCPADRNIWVDVDEFERLAASPEGSEAAVALYGGDFLPHIDHDWAVSKRERLRRLACRTLETALERRRAQGDVRGSLGYVEQLLAHDMWREDALRDLMLLRSQLGDRAGALTFYSGFRDRLWTEFGVEPLPQTVNCYDFVRGGRTCETWTREITC